MSENSAGPGEPVRLPGIIHIEEEDIHCKLNMLTVDTSDTDPGHLVQQPPASEKSPRTKPSLR